MTLPDGSVCLYADAAQNPEHLERGIPRYIAEQLAAIHALRPELIHSVLLNPALPVPGTLNRLLGTGVLRFSRDGRGFGTVPRPRPSVFHLMSPFSWGTGLSMPWPQWARDPRIATVVNLYDLIPLVFEGGYLRDPYWQAAYKTRCELVRSADGVLAISESTATDAVERLGISPERIHVVGAGASDAQSRMYPSTESAWNALAPRFGEIRPGFLFYVGGGDFRKNHEGLVTAYARLPSRLRARHQLVITCRPPEPELMRLRKLAHELSLAPGQLILTGRLTEAELAALYSTCRLFVFPSLYEGSGLPVLEAMRAGAPVAAANTSSVPELLGDTEATFDPHDPAAISACLTRVLDSQVQLERLRWRSQRQAAEHTWAAVGRRTLEAYEQIARPGPRVRPLARPRIALVTPWPPEPSGIADYSARLVDALATHIDVDIVVRRSVHHYVPSRASGTRLLSARDFAMLERVRPHDRVLYCMGNSSYHGYMYDLLAVRPGAVLMHDVQLMDFYVWRASVRFPDDPLSSFARLVHSMYADRSMVQALGTLPMTHDTCVALGIYMTREIQSRAEECFVHSCHARDVLALDRTPLVAPPAVTVMPFGMPEPAPDAAREASATPTIVSLGWLHEYKDLDTLIAAFAQVHGRRPGARLVLAGADVRGDHWLLRARELAPGATIEVPGRLSAERYGELLREADLAVQLRRASHGEASAAVCDCLAAGVPTIVSDAGWARELPPGAVSRVPQSIPAAELAARIDQLLDDQPARRGLSISARELARSRSFAPVADIYVEALGLA